MTPAESQVFASLLAGARRYVEFGAGGSTVLAAELVRESVISFDSSREWLDRVIEACGARNTRLTPGLVLLDIGETGDWGFPKGRDSRDRWPLYHSSMWGDPRPAAADFYLIDGRFRVACFTQVLLHAGADALVAVHDYTTRPHYHRITEIAQEVRRVNDLSLFTRRADFDRRTALHLLEDHAYDPR